MKYKNTTIHVCYVIWKQNINIDRKYGKKTDDHNFLEDNQFTFLNSFMK